MLTRRVFRDTVNRAYSTACIMSTNVVFVTSIMMARTIHFGVYNRLIETIIIII